MSPARLTGIIGCLNEGCSGISFRALIMSCSGLSSSSVGGIAYSFSGGMRPMPIMRLARIDKIYQLCGIITYVGTN